MSSVVKTLWRRSKDSGKTWQAVRLVVFAIFGIAFYCGSVLLDYDPGKLLTVFFCILMGAINLQQAAPSLESISIARSAAKPVYDIIERESKILAADTKSGRKIHNLKGKIEFKNGRAIAQYAPSAPACAFLHHGQYDR